MHLDHVTAEVVAPIEASAAKMTLAVALWIVSRLYVPSQISANGERASAHLTQMLIVHLTFNIVANRSTQEITLRSTQASNTIAQ